MITRAAAARPVSVRTMGRAGLAVTAASVAATFTVAVLGPSVMESALPGRPGQPPWSAGAAPSPYLVVALTGFAILAGTLGLWLTLRAARRGWTVSVWAILAAGLLAAIALAFVPPFGSSDQLSYAAYGHMVVTGHDPYTTTPAALARLGDPVARAVQDWRTTPSVYGGLATGGQALASAIGGTSVRLTIFVLSLLNVVAFALTGLLLHGLARGGRKRQLRAALLWTANPLLLQVLVAGAHVDSQAIVWAVAAVAVLALAWQAPAHEASTAHQASTHQASAIDQASTAGQASTARQASAAGQESTAPAGRLRAVRLGGAAVGAGALIGMGFAVKATMALIGAGLAIGAVLAVLAETRLADPGQADPGLADTGLAEQGRADREPGPGPARRLVLILGGLAVGFAAVAGASLVRWGTGALSPALNEGSFVSIGSPWRAARSLVGLGTGEGVAEDLVKWAAVALALVLAVLLYRSIWRAPPGRWPQTGLLADGGTPARKRAAPTGPPDLQTAPAGPGLPGYRPAAETGFWIAVAFAIAFAWLTAWPYVLPWYDGLGWVFLALLPASRLDWLLLARTAALAVGYLPGRTIAMPADLGWLRTVVRTGVTPLILLGVTVTVLVLLWPRREPDAISPGRPRAHGNAGDARRSRPSRLA